MAEMRSGQKKIGIVPTMGALHEGHLSLVRSATAECDITFVTIFVNPTQFGPKEDFTKYPRTLNEDVVLLSRERVDVVFAPSADEMYPRDYSTSIEPSTVARPLEGVCRPGHFRGVATIVLKLFHVIPADVAYFGQKDFQQCRVIERMVADLNLPIEIRRCPIVREPDGLAISSRNRYLSPDERRQALAISRCLRTGQQLILDGETKVSLIRDAMRVVLTDAGITRIDYVAVADPETLGELDQVGRRAVLLVAAYVGQTRLIDNCLVG
jgi:pantoate--beta-alanine ligase